MRLRVCRNLDRMHLDRKGCILQADRLIEANNWEASDVGISMCVMFAQTDEQKRFYVLDEDNNLPRPCMEYEAAAKKIG